MNNMEDNFPEQRKSLEVPEFRTSKIEMLSELHIGEVL